MSKYTVERGTDAISVTFNNPEELQKLQKEYLAHWHTAGFRNAPYGHFTITGWLPELATMLALGTDYDTAAAAVLDDDWSKTDILHDGLSIQVKSSNKKHQYDHAHPNIVQSMAKRTLAAVDVVVWAYLVNAETYVGSKSVAGDDVRLLKRINKSEPITVVLRHAMHTEGVDLGSMTPKKTYNTKSYVFDEVASPASSFDLFATRN